MTSLAEHSPIAPAASAPPPEAAAAPRVTVIVPCRDEERFIEGALASILDGAWPRDRLEVLVVDGRSRDGTRARVEALAARDPRVRLLDNPRGTTPCALNIGVRAARGDILVRADAHCTFPPDFVAGQVRALLDTGADMVGPAPDNVPAADTPMARAIALALGSPFGTGSPMRFRRGGGDSDAAPFGCWRRELFDRVGLFDERLLRNQDNEHSARILRGGGRVHVCADVRVQYHPRPTLAALMRQATQNGTWNAFTERLHPYTFRARHVLPGVFFLGVIFCAALAVAGALTDGRLALAAAALVAPYGLAGALAALAIAARERRASLLFLLPVVFAGYHFAYGYGIVVGWSLVATGRWRDRLGASRPWDEPAQRRPEEAA